MAPHIYVGTSSWTDPTLVKDSGFYPRRSMTAEERLRFYAARFPLVEVDSTYYFPPSEETARRWVERTPTGFRMDVKAYGLFTRHPVRPQSLWQDMLADLPADIREKRNLYVHHLPEEMVDVAWERFRRGLAPLVESQRLGAVMFQFPRWFLPGGDSHAWLEDLPRRLPGTRIGVEFRNGAWLRDDRRPRTLQRLRDLGLAYVCVDEPQGFKSSVPPVVEATTDLAVVRFHGRNAEAWEKKGLTPAERFRYLYSEAELTGWTAPLRDLAGSAAETHVLFNNCYRDHGVVNARQMAGLLGDDAVAPRGDP